MKCQICEDVGQGHCCECGEPIPLGEQQLTNGHLYCAFHRHPKFREPSTEIIVEEYSPPEKTPAFLPEDYPELIPPTFKNRDPSPNETSWSHICTCDGGMELPDPDRPGYCARCNCVIDREEAELYEKQRRKEELHNGLTPEKQRMSLICRLLEALKPTRPD